MSDELREPLLDALDVLRVRLAEGEYGDPHVGFLVLVKPDAAPTIVVVSPAGAHDMTRITKGDGSEGPRFFTYDELHEAKGALDGAELAITVFGRGRDDVPLGQHVAEWIEREWTRHRDYPMQHALEQAAREAAEPFACACGQRYKTERGLKTHQTRSPYARCVPAAVGSVPQGRTP